MNLDFTTLNDSDFSANGGSRKDPNKLECKPENGQNNQYECYMRFLPYIYDTKKSMYSKNLVHIKNPSVAKEGITFDCPKTIGVASFFYALDEVLKKKELAEVEKDITKEIRKSFSRWYQIHSVVYIMNDPIKRDNVGKIKIYTYGSKINKLIELEQQGTQTKPKVQVFDFLNGKDFYYYATKQNRSFANYDQCKFLDPQKPFTFYLADGSIHTVTADELVAMKNGQETPLSKLLIENTPKLDAYYYKAPTTEELQKAANYLKIILSRFPVIFNEAMSTCADEDFKAMIMNASAPNVQQFEQQQNQQFQPMGMQQPMGQQFQQPAQQFQQPMSQPVQQFKQPMVQQFQQPMSQPTENVGFPQMNITTQPAQPGFVPQPAQPVIENVQQPIAPVIAQQGFTPQPAQPVPNVIPQAGGEVQGFQENNAFAAAMANL